MFIYIYRERERERYVYVYKYIYIYIYIQVYTILIHTIYIYIYILYVPYICDPSRAREFWRASRPGWGLLFLYLVQIDYCIVYIYIYIYIYGCLGLMMGFQECCWRVLFRHPSIRRIAEQLDTSQTNTRDNIVPSGMICYDTI